MAAALQERSFSLSNARGDAVHGDLRFVDDGAPKPVVVFCHGFKGFKDWGPFPTWGRRLANAGFASVLFNFSHNGVHPDAPTEFTQPDRFAQNTFTRELDDLTAVLDAVDDGTLEAPFETEGLGLMGHSRGGGTAILQAARDPRVEALVTWSAVSSFIDRFTDDQIEDWETQGYTTVLNSRTGQTMRLNRVLYDDALAHADALDIQAAAAEIDVPVAHRPRRRRRSRALRRGRSARRCRDGRRAVHRAGRAHLRRAAPVQRHTAHVSRRRLGPHAALLPRPPEGGGGVVKRKTIELSQKQKAPNALGRNALGALKGGDAGSRTRVRIAAPMSLYLHSGSILSRVRLKPTHEARRTHRLIKFCRHACSRNARD